MANTRYLTTVVEDYVRKRLAVEFGLPFEKRTLPLRPGGCHEFDAVSSECMPLPTDMQKRVDEVVKIASGEVSPASAAQAVASEIEAAAEERT